MFESTGGGPYVLSSLGDSGIHWSSSRPKIPSSHMDLLDGTWQGAPYLLTAWLGTSVKSYMNAHMNVFPTYIQRVAIISIILVLGWCPSWVSRWCGWCWEECLDDYSLKHSHSYIKNLREYYKYWNYSRNIHLD